MQEGREQRRFTLPIASLGVDSRGWRACDPGCRPNGEGHRERLQADASFGPAITVGTRGDPQYAPTHISPQQTLRARGTTRFDGTIFVEAQGGRLTIFSTSGDSSTTSLSPATRSNGGRGLLRDHLRRPGEPPGPQRRNVHEQRSHTGQRPYRDRRGRRAPRRRRGMSAVRASHAFLLLISHRSLAIREGFWRQCSSIHGVLSSAVNCAPIFRCLASCAREQARSQVRRRVLSRAATAA